MLSRFLAGSSSLRTPLAGFLACAILLAAAPSADARVYIRGGQQGASEYGDQLASAGSVEGDIWGGEQINTPDDPSDDTTVKLDDPVVHEDPVPFTKTSPWTRFWTKLATLLRHFGL